jgi:hypothetical protein
VLWPHVAAAQFATPGALHNTLIQVNEAHHVKVQLFRLDGCAVQGGACCCIRQHAVLRRWVSSNTAAAVVARSASTTDVATAAPAMGLLSTNDLQQYLAKHNIVVCAWHCEKDS